MKKLLHRGLNYRRTETVYDGWTNREKLFADEWEKENDYELRSNVNYGMGILQDLMVEQKGDPFELWYYPKTCTFIIKKRDAAIVATVIQWLGSNVGFCFLTTCLEKCGYTLTKKERA